MRLKIVHIFFFSFLMMNFAGCQKSGKTLPHIGFHQPIKKYIDGKTIIDTIYHTVPDFEFINQKHQKITQQILENKVTVVNFIFTSCPTICPKQTKQLQLIQEKTKGLKNYLQLSFTVDPKRDSPEKLKQFGKKYQANFSNWHFLRAEQKVVYELGMNGFYLGMGKDNLAEGGFFHSSNLVLVDQNKHIRGMYDSFDEKQVNQLVDDIKFLLKENKQ
ncbi:MAG: SCO family protein [Flavobacteriaceae bacterium]|nr:SCO family protein [Flavobacteriaceae bacterium]